MDVFIEKAKVKKVLRRKEYQEVFFKSRLLNGSKSLKIYDCKKDIASLLKKSFWGCRSVFEIHWLRLFPVKVCLDGVPLREFEEKDYPEELKIRLMPEEERDKMFLDRLSAFLQSYPKKDDFDVAVYSLPSLWLRAYACALLGKARKNGYLDDELQQRRYSLMLDLLKMLDEPDCWLPLPAEWPFCLSGLGGVSEEVRENVAKRMNIQLSDRMISIYFVCLISALRYAYRSDIFELKSYISQNYGMFSSKKIDKALLLGCNGILSLYRLSKCVPNFIIDAQLSLEEIKYYLSQQNW